MRCDRSFFVKNSEFAVPCGKCINCLQKRSAQWAFRLNQESKNHSTAFFVTLTYDEQNVPITPDFSRTLVKKHLQDYCKRVRKYANIKYYAVGEYGSKTHRPHYHLIIFGASADLLQSKWHYGHSQIDMVSDASIRYVTNYVVKTRLNKKQLGQRQREFSHMSKGLGINYLSNQVIKWHKADIKNYVCLPGGKKESLPRYFREKIFDEDERILIQIDSQMRSKKVEEKLLKEHPDTALKLNLKAEIQQHNDQKLLNQTKNRKHV